MTSPTDIPAPLRDDLSRANSHFTNDLYERIVDPGGWPRG